MSNRFLVMVQLLVVMVIVVVSHLVVLEEDCSPRLPLRAEMTGMKEAKTMN